MLVRVISDRIILRRRPPFRNRSPMQDNFFSNISTMKHPIVNMLITDGDDYADIRLSREMTKHSENRRHNPDYPLRIINNCESVSQKSSFRAACTGRGLSELSAYFDNPFSDVLFTVGLSFKFNIPLMLHFTVAYKSI